MKKKLIIPCVILVIMMLIPATILLAASTQKADGSMIYLSDLSYESYKVESPYTPWIDDDSTGNGKINICDLMTFEKGIRLHPGIDYDAEIVYDISKLNAYSFEAYIGKDARGSVGATQFFVYLDGKLLYTSKIMAWGDCEYVKLNVAGGKKLRLVQNDGGDGYAFDGGCWGDAKLRCLDPEGGVKIACDSYAITGELEVSGSAFADSVNIYINGTKVGTVATADSPNWKTAVKVPSSVAKGTELTVRAESVVGGTVSKSDEISCMYIAAVSPLSEVTCSESSDADALLTDSSLFGTLTAGSTSVGNGYEFRTLSSGDTGIVFDISGSGYRYFEAFAGINAFSRAPSDASAVFVVKADGKVIFESNPVTPGGVVKISAAIPASAANLTLSSRSVSGGRLYVNWCDPVVALSEDATVSSDIDLRTGAQTAAELAGPAMRFAFSGKLSAIVLNTSGALPDGVIMKIYGFDYSFSRTLQEDPVVSVSSFSGQDGEYYIPIFGGLDGGDYLLTFESSEAISCKTYSSTSTAILSLGGAARGALPLRLIFSEGGELTAVPDDAPAIRGTAAQSDETKSAETLYRGWMDDFSTFPASFSIGGKRYIGFGTDFEQVSQNTETVGKASRTVTVLRHISGLEFTVTSNYYPGYAAFDWMFEIEYTGNGNSPIISDIISAQLSFKGSDPYIHTSEGDSQQFLPKNLRLDGSTVFTPVGGRSAMGAFPYYNFEYGDRGVMIAVGWTGQWRTAFDNSADPAVTLFEAGQQTFNAYITDSEKVRTPLTAFLLYEGKDLDRAGNLWRRWFLDCCMHKVLDENGEETLFAPGISGGTSIQFAEMTLATDENQINAIRNYVNNNIGISYWWMDAGWYFNTGDVSLGTGDWGPTGTWKVDTSRFPSKMADISDYGASVGVKTLLWFEPERVGLSDFRTDGSTVKREWVTGSIVNYSIDEAREWIKNRILTVMGEGHITLYREDFNTNPLGDWQAADAKLGADRQGITENLYIQGHYEIWDSILKAYPSAMIDSCSSGGYRNDFETIKRAVALHKTDFNYGDLSAQQCYALEMSSWIPYYGTKADTSGTTHFADKYALRTAMVPFMVLGYDSDKPIDWGIVKDAADEQRFIRQYIYSDFYKLTPYSRSENAWVAWEYFDTDSDSGYALLFRHAAAPATRLVKLKGLDADTTYHVWFEDRGAHRTATGLELMEKGVEVTLPFGESSDILHISRDYTPRTLEGSVTYVSSNGQYKKAITFATSYSRIDLRFNMSLRDTVFADTSFVENKVEADYADYITVNGTLLSAMPAEHYYMDYDAENNILRLFIKRGVIDESNITVTVGTGLTTYEGVAPAAEMSFNYTRDTKEWSRLGVEAESVALSIAADEMLVGDKVIATALVTPFDATDRNVSWSSSDESVAQIDDEGNVTAVGLGHAVITATVSGIAKTVEIDVVEVLSKDTEPVTEPVTEPPVSDSETLTPDPGSKSNTGLLIAAAAVGALLIAGAVYFIIKKRRR